jgi:hypothetical protein
VRVGVGDVVFVFVFVLVLVVDVDVGCGRGRLLEPRPSPATASVLPLQRGPSWRLVFGRGIDGEGRRGVSALGEAGRQDGTGRGGGGGGGGGGAAAAAFTVGDGRYVTAQVSC